jgi:hypothetical protein
MTTMDAILKACAVLALSCCAACGGAAFSSLGENHNAPDAETGDSGGAESDTPDAGGETEATTPPEAGHDSAPSDGDGGALDSGSPKPDAGGIGFAACESYFHAFESDCSCVVGNTCTQAIDDAGCNDVLTHCTFDVCGWDGGTSPDPATLCGCIEPCLGSCRAPNDLFFECKTATCAATCP